MSGPKKKSVNFCGDSFCVDIAEWSWTAQLANLLDSKIVGRGMGGSSHEHAIRSFDSTVDYTVFCWTEENRLYHTEYGLNTQTAITYANKNNIYKSAYAYYKFLHDSELSKERFIRDLYWFDRERLANYKGICVHLFNFKKLYKFDNGYNYETLLRDICIPNASYDPLSYNHLSKETSTQLANSIYEIIANNSS